MPPKRSRPSAMRSSSSANTSNRVGPSGRKALALRRLRAPFACLGSGAGPVCDPRPLSAALLSAYRATDYAVDGRPDWTLRVGATCRSLMPLLAAAGAPGAAFVSAWNPRGRRAPTRVNVTAHARLLARLHRQGASVWPGWGRGDAGDWPPERSVLAIGPSLPEAIALARDFGQRALVWLPAGGVAVIVPTRPQAD